MEGNITSQLEIYGNLIMQIRNNFVDVEKLEVQFLKVVNCNDCKCFN
jgi:hypothetical protein